MGQIFSGIGQLVGSNMQADAATQQLQDETAATMAADQMKAGQAQREGLFNVSKLRTQSSTTLAKQKVAYANSGVDSTVGTPASVQANTAAQGEVDIQTAKNNAALEVWGYREHARLTKYESYAKQGQINAARYGGVLGASGQLAQGGSQLASMLG